MKCKLLSINKIVRRRTNETIAEVRVITGTMADMAKETFKRAQSMLKTLIPETKQDETLKLNLLETVQTVETVIVQTELVNSGGKPENRIVSIIDTDARPISKGKLGQRVQFGNTLQIEEVPEGIVTGYSVHKGNPSDKTLLVDAVHHHKKNFDKAPREIAVDRGYYSKRNEDELTLLGVKHISCLKRSFGLRRSNLRGQTGTSIWCGYGILSHNLRKAARLLMGVRSPQI